MEEAAPPTGSGPARAGESAAAKKAGPVPLRLRARPDANRYLVFRRRPGRDRSRAGEHSRS